MKLDHVGIAVKNLAERLRFYQEGLGLAALKEERVPGEDVRVAFLPLAGSRLELLEPTGPASTVAKFISRRGEGIHHLCFAVQDLAETLANLRAAGVELVEGPVRMGAGGSRIAFIHPRGTGGVLIELKQGVRN